MYAQDAAELFPSDDDEESITLNPEERKAVRKRLEKANQLEKENRELREKLRRAQDELRRIKTSAPFLAASDLSLARRVARRATRDAPASAPSPTPLRSDSPSNDVGSVAPGSESRSRFVGGPSPTFLDLNPVSSMWRSPATRARAATVGWSRTVPTLAAALSGLLSCPGWSTFGCSG